MKILQSYQKRTLVRDLTVGLVLTIVIVVMLLGSLYYYFSVTQIEKNLHHKAVNLAQELAESAGVLVWNMDKAAISKTAEAYLRADEVVSLHIVDDANEPIYESSDTSETDLITAIKDISYNGRVVGQVQVALTRRTIRQEQYNILYSTFIIMVVVGGAVVVGTQFLIQRLLAQPLAILTQGIEAVAEGNYAQLLPPLKQADIDTIAQKVNVMAGRIRELVETLEQRVAARTYRLEMIAKLSEQLNAILNFDPLLNELVNQVKERFNYYHVQIYILDGQNLVLRAGAGETGAKMKEQAFAIPLDASTSLIARAARTHEVVAVDNVRLEADWLAHPLLPETYSEMVVPIIANDQVVGVLDVQENKVAGFDDSDANLFRSLANQVAVGLTNARLFEQVRQSKESADAANQAKSDFLSNMSHELRTPLNGILGYAQILKRNKELTTLQKDGLNIIQQSGEHLLTLITDILDLSKIEAGKLELYPTDFNFADFLGGVAGIIRIRTQQKGIGFALDTPETGAGSIPPNLHGDEKRLRQILINLLNNAVKFTDHGSVTLKVEVRNQELGIRNQESPPLIPNSQSLIPRIRFEVKDTGIGMKPDELEKIFRPFEQVGDTRRRSEGTGLGLAITRKLVQAMNSELHVESEYGQGSSFWFEVLLPISHETEIRKKDTVEREIIGYQGRRRKVLVVDDKQHNRSVMVNILEPLGFEMIEASNGHDGIRLASQLKPDLIIMDMIMPVMTGFEATEEIHKLPDLKDVIVLGASANVFESDQEQAILAGCSAFLSKPVEVKKLLLLIEKHLHIEWAYEETSAVPITAQTVEPTPPVSVEMVVPPPEDMAMLLDLAKGGRLQKIRSFASQLEQKDIKYKAFAQELLELAKGFKSKEILALIEKNTVS